MTQTNQLTKLTTASLEKLFLKGDLSVLSPEEKMAYYTEYCNRLGLDPFTQPFKLLNLNGKEVLYCDRSGTQQLSKLHNVSHEIKSREVINECYVVTAQASADGRHTESTGAVPINKAGGEWTTSSSGKKFFKADGTFKPLTGEELCNAMMKAETKAKRRATLDLLGLGVLDESEVETIPNAITSSPLITSVPYEPIESKKDSKNEAKEAAIERLKDSKDIKELAAQYNTLSNELKKDAEVISITNELKIKLTPVAA